jgi:hypothetical protein
MVVGYSIEVTIRIETAPERPQRFKNQRTTRINIEHIVGFVCPIHDHILNALALAENKKPLAFARGFWGRRGK